MKCDWEVTPLIVLNFIFYFKYILPSTLHGTTSCNDNFTFWFTKFGPYSIHFLNNIIARCYFPKNYMFTIQPWCFPGTDEELTTIGVWSSYTMIDKMNVAVERTKI